MWNFLSAEAQAPPRVSRFPSRLTSALSVSISKCRSSGPTLGLPPPSRADICPLSQQKLPPALLCQGRSQGSGAPLGRVVSGPLQALPSPPVPAPGPCPGVEGVCVTPKACCQVSQSLLAVSFLWPSRSLFTFPPHPHPRPGDHHSHTMAVTLPCALPRPWTPSGPGAILLVQERDPLPPGHPGGSCLGPGCQSLGSAVLPFPPCLHTQPHQVFQSLCPSQREAGIVLPVLPLCLDAVGTSTQWLMAALA